MKLYSFIIISFLIISCRESNIQVTGDTMGTYYSVKINETRLDAHKLKADLDKLLREFNQVFSTYIKDSELSLINQAKKDREINLSDELNFLLELSKDISRIGENSFDITVGPLVNAWGFGPDGKRNIPTEEEIQELRQYVGMDKIILEKGKLKKLADEVYIDLSAIAKGHGVDAVVNFLKGQGVTSAIVEIGGEVRTIGKKDSKNRWRVGLEKPSEKQTGELEAIIQLEDMAMATSGSYRNYRKYRESFFSHTIDPRTGKPVNHTLISVTVVSDTCAKADGLATALMVLGPKNGPELVEKLGIPAYFVYKEGEKVLEKHSQQMEQFLLKRNQ